MTPSAAVASCAAARSRVGWSAGLERSIDRRASGRGWVEREVWLSSDGNSFLSVTHGLAPGTPGAAGASYFAGGRAYVRSALPRRRGVRGAPNQPEEPHMRNRLVFPALILLGAACGGGGDRSASGGADSSRGGDGAAAGRSSDASAACAPDNGGITLPEGFCASVFADSLGHARHITVAPNGDVYVNSWSGPYYRDSTPADRPFLVALRDTNRDGRADVVQRFGETRQAKSDGGTGIALYGGYLYAESGPRIVRYQMAQGQLAPSGQAEVIVRSEERRVG